MINYSLNLFRDIEERALKNRFNSELDQEASTIFAYCKEHYASQVVQRVAYRIHQKRIDCIAVDTVLSSLLPVCSKIMCLKYAKQMQMTKISMECGLSVARIVELDHDVREEIGDMLRLQLQRHNIYSRLKVVNMVHIIDLKLGFFQDFPEIAASANRDWISALRELREKYRNLYTMINNVIREKDSNMHCNIIATKFEYPNATRKELSAMCHVSQSGICRHLQRFEDKASTYLID